MKTIITILTIMLSVANAFAAEGDADKVAGAAIGIFYMVLFFACIAGIGVVLCEFAEWCENMWNNSTTVGRLIIFGIPLTVVSTSIFYGLFYYVIPAVVHSTFGQVIAGIIMYLLCMCVGWTEKYGSTEKRDGKIATVARGIVLFPILPVIYTGYYIVQLFKKLCLKDTKIELNPYIVRKKYAE